MIRYYQCPPSEALGKAHTPMIDFLSWSHAAVLSPSQCPPQRPEEGNVERVMTIPRWPVTSCIALVVRGEKEWIEGEFEGGPAWSHITERGVRLEHEGGSGARF